MRSVCRQHSYMSVPGITRSSTKWQVMNQSSGWMSASARMSPRPNRPPRGIERRDAVHQGHPAAGQAERVGQVEPVERRAERGGQVAPAQGVDLPRRRASTAATGTSSAQSSGLTPATGRASSGRGTIPLPAASSSAVKNPAQPSRIVSSGSPSTVAVEPEPEQVRLPLAEEARDPDVVADHLAGARAGRGGT